VNKVGCHAKGLLVSLVMADEVGLLVMTLVMADEVGLLVMTLDCLFRRWTSDLALVMTLGYLF